MPNQPDALRVNTQQVEGWRRWGPQREDWSEAKPAVLGCPVTGSRSGEPSPVTGRRSGHSSSAETNEGRPMGSRLRQMPSTICSAAATAPLVGTRPISPTPLMP